VRLPIFLLQQSVAAKIEFGDGILPLLVDLLGGFDAMRGRRWIGVLGRSK
jgi:hypothetical protein